MRCEIPYSVGIQAAILIKLSRLEGLHYAHGHYSHYEPELFPGLIYRMVEPKVVFLVFVSGKIVITGAKVSHFL